jgi:hypothetical protein
MSRYIVHVQLECRALPYHLSRRVRVTLAELTRVLRGETRAGAPSGKPYQANTGSHEWQIVMMEDQKKRAHNTLCMLNQLDPFTVCTLAHAPEHGMTDHMPY